MILGDAIEHLLAVRARPNASFEDLDQAIDLVREAYEAWRAGLRGAVVDQSNIVARVMTLEPGDAGVVVPMRPRAHP